MSPVRQGRWTRPGRRGLLGALGGVAMIALMSATMAFAVHDDGTFELDKNASNNTNITPVGWLVGNINATVTSINVCMTAPGTTQVPRPVVDDILLVRAERMKVTSVNENASFGGSCPGLKWAFGVQRGVAPTTATTQTGGANNVAAGVSLIRSATKAGPDWNQVFTSVTADTNNTGDDDKCITIGLVECAYIEDGIGPTTFTGGGTKDHLPVSGWQHTSGASPDKGEILNAYAAKAISADEHQLLYFGMDRYAVDGSTDIGFWFFKEEVSLNADGTFSGDQSVGDILALGTFTQGGATSNIRVFKWVGTGGNESGTIEGPIDTYSDCVPGSNNDAGCATVNNATIEVPWTYTFKGDAVGKWVPLGGFFEGGIDLTANQLDGCFASFLAETRSSPEITAVLKDFALGSFESCDTTVTTTPGDGVAGTGNAALTDGDDADTLVETSIGTGSVLVRDRATVVVQGVTNWSGTLDFYLCKLDDPALCDGTTGKVGTKIGSTININQATPQPIISDAAEVTSVGRYCWRADFTSSTTGVPNGSDSAITECFEVNPVTPTLTTSATTVVQLGSPISDTATLGGTANKPGTPIINPTTAGGAAGGTIVFKIYGPGDDDCTGTATTVSTEDVTGNGDYTSDDFTATAAGTYRWIATYSGDSPNTNGKSGACNDEGETSTVVDAKIELSPLTATNEVGEDHVITATVKQDVGDGWVNPPDGTLVTFSLLNNDANASFVGGTSTCTTTAGQCTVTINTTTPGDVDIHATTTFSVAGFELTRETDGQGSNSGDANKIYVDASIAISPLTATNNVDEQHVFTITVTSEPAGADVTFDSITPSISPSPDDYETTCLTPDTSVADQATCTVTINHGSAATFTLNATAVLTIEGLEVTRDTDPATGAIGSGPDGTGPATKTYVEGSFTWLKDDQDGEPLGGATFEVCQTHVYVTTGLTPSLVEIVDENEDPDPICQFVTDNESPDTDTDPGELKLEGLSLGTYTVKETAAPDGYAFDPSDVKDVTLTFETPNGSISTPFVNNRLYKMIILVCNQSLGTLEESSVDLDGVLTVTSGDIPASLAELGVTEAIICGLTEGAVYPDLDQGTYTPSVTIPKPE